MSSPTAPSTAEEILKGLGEVAKASTARATAYASSYAATYATPENGNYTLQVLFYMFLYAFILFLALILIHFTIYPVFKFTPGAKGLIGVSSTKDSIVYWNNKKQPTVDTYAPIDKDALTKLPLTNNFSVSVDLFVRRMTDTNASTRVILYKTYANGVGVTPPTVIADPLAVGPSQLSPPVTDLTNQYMNSRVSMFMYLTETNDLVVTFFSGSTGTPYSTRPIKNIPLYKPFRVTIVVEDKTFTVYINAQQAFQRTIPLTPIALNTNIPAGSLSSSQLATQRFFPPPTWADLPVKTVFLQNLQVWPRAIRYAEVQTAQPALALEADFGMSSESGSSSCDT